jgi:putative transposase
VKYAWLDSQLHSYPVLALCEVLEVSFSGYRSWKRGGTPQRKRLTDIQLLALIRSVHAEVKGAYGSPRMTIEIRARGFPAGKERVERLMRENNIRARHKRRYKVTTDSKHKLPIAPNLLDRNFTTDAPNQVFTSDITYIWTDEGWLYLAIVLDLFNREIVGWSIKANMTTDLVIDALTMAWFRRKPAPGALYHSDRGSQGGFNRSLQHLLKEVSNGTTTGLGFATDRKTNNAIARQARCQSARDKASVLELCRARHGERGCGAGVWRVPTFGAKMVS